MPVLLLGRPHQTILRALARYHYLTNLQLTRLLFSAGSASYVRQITKNLSDEEYILKLHLPMPPEQRFGSTPIAYTLARKGRSWCTREGLKITTRFRPSEERAKSQLFLPHTLAVNDFLISLATLKSQTDWAYLQGFAHERTLKRVPFSLTGEEGEKLVYSPDAWVNLRVTSKGQWYQFAALVEVDRDTEEQRQWRRKIGAILACVRGIHSPYQERFRTESVTVLTLTTAGDKRLHELVHWTERELERSAARDMADLFRFTTARPATLPAQELVWAECWRRPFLRRPLSLLGDFLHES